MSQFLIERTNSAVTFFPQRNDIFNSDSRNAEFGNLTDKEDKKQVPEEPLCAK